MRVELENTIQAAVALIFASPAGGDAELLLIKRARHEKDPWSGQMGFPGGRRDGGDRDLEETVRREVKEEIGVDLKEGEHLGELDDLYPNIPALPPVVVRPFVYVFDETPPVTSNKEVQQVFWYPVDAFAAHAERVKLTIRGVEREVFGYDMDGNLVWGMTERILSPLLERIADESRS